MAAPAFTVDSPGFVVWLDDAPLVRTRTLDEARAAYLAALDLATQARDQLNRTLERV
jgi:hypothetical protein